MHPSCVAAVPQVELRVLAHLSGDPALCALLQRAGAGGDAFLHIAARWLGSGGLPLHSQRCCTAKDCLPASKRGWLACALRCAADAASHVMHAVVAAHAAGDVEHVSKEQREKAKRVTYGIIVSRAGWAEGWGWGEGGGIGGSCQARSIVRFFLGVLSRHSAVPSLLCARCAAQLQPHGPFPASPSRLPARLQYGLTPYGLAQGSGALGISVQAAQVRYSALWCASVRVRARVGRVWNGLPWGPRGRLAWSA
jgi:hypothetical protein